MGFHLLRVFYASDLDKYTDFLLLKFCDILYVSIPTVENLTSLESKKTPANLSVNCEIVNFLAF